MSELESAQDNPGVIAFPPLMWAIGAVVSTVVHFFVTRAPMATNHRLTTLFGIILALIAPTLAISALITFRKAGTNVDPAKPALVIARGGPYRFTRNPMYLALCLLQIALGLLLNDWVTLVFVAPFLLLHFGVVLREERYLTKKFGEPYLELKRNVRRWL